MANGVLFNRGLIDDPFNYLSKLQSSCVFKIFSTDEDSVKILSMVVGFDHGN